MVERINMYSQIDEVVELIDLLHDATTENKMYLLGYIRGVRDGQTAKPDAR